MAKPTVGGDFFSLIENVFLSSLVVETICTFTKEIIQRGKYETKDLVILSAHGRYGADFCERGF